MWRSRSFLLYLKCNKAKTGSSAINGSYITSAELMRAASTPELSNVARATERDAVCQWNSKRAGVDTAVSCSSDDLKPLEIAFAPGVCYAIQGQWGSMAGAVRSTRVSNLAP